MMLQKDKVKPMKHGWPPLLLLLIGILLLSSNLRQRTEEGTSSANGVLTLGDSIPDIPICSMSSMTVSPRVMGASNEMGSSKVHKYEIKSVQMQMKSPFERTMDRRTDGLIRELSRRSRSSYVGDYSGGRRRHH